MEELIKKMVLERYGIPISCETKISEVVEDSLGRIELLFELENSVGKTVSHDEVLDLETFGDLIKALK
jgi:acyl carrier protein